MMQARDTKDISQDVEAVYDIAQRLLSIDGSADERSLSWVIANNFVKTANDISLETLLKVRKFDCQLWHFRTNKCLAPFLQHWPRLSLSSIHLGITFAYPDSEQSGSSMKK
jgi:hypothetical protein